MVNFYNDYVNCKQTATLSDVAGEQLLRQWQLPTAWTTFTLSRLQTFSPHHCCSPHRSLWLYKETGWSRNHRFWWRLRRRHKVSTEERAKRRFHRYVVEAEDTSVRLPEGLEDVSKVPNLVAELLRRGWTDEEMKAALGKNLLRVLSEAEKVRSR